MGHGPVSRAFVAVLTPRLEQNPTFCRQDADGLHIPWPMLATVDGSWSPITVVAFWLSFFSGALCDALD